jgi:2,4-dienoyl-CoA reductase-like NADH-dependent reductase (Old Yellow Enzyme family)
MTDTPETPALFQPLALRGVTARNRIMVSPMCQYRSDDGGPNDWHLAHLGRFAMGGAAIVFGDETAVEDRGRKTYSCAGIWADAHIPAYRRITDFIKSQGALPAIQLGHSGNKASSERAPGGAWRPLTAEDAAKGKAPWLGLSASAVAMDDEHAPPREMDRDDIRAVQDAFVEATKRSLDAGFDIVEVHGAHGYLIHQFLSPLTNQRTDAYGGDREGRMRFALETTEKVRAAWPADRPLFFRVSSIDGKGGKWDFNDTLALTAALKERGVDVIDCSSGGIQGDSAMPVVPWIAGHHVPYAAKIKRDTGLMTAAVGMITDPHQAEAIIASGHADIVALARELLLQGDWPARAALELGLPDPYGLLPSAYANRLRRREKARAHRLNQVAPRDARFPVSETETMSMPD